MASSKEATNEQVLPENSRVVLTTGNFCGSLFASTLVGFNVAMNQYMEGKAINVSPPVYARACLFYLRYIPAAVLAASGLAFYGTSPLMQKFAGVPPEAANVLALASVGPALSPLYARQEGGITLVSLWNMKQADALAIIKRHATLGVFAPGTLFTFLRNSISLGVGGALAADGGQTVSRLVVPSQLRETHATASKIVANGLVGVVAGFVSSGFEFLRISRVIAAGKDEHFSMQKHFLELLKQRSFIPFAALRSTQLGCFYACFIGGGEIAKHHSAHIHSACESISSLWTKR